MVRDTIKTLGAVLDRGLKFSDHITQCFPGGFEKSARSVQVSTYPSRGSQAVAGPIASVVSAVSALLLFACIWQQYY